MSIRVAAVTGGVLLLSLPPFVAEGRAVMWGARRRSPANSVESASVDGTIERVATGRILVTTGPPANGQTGRNNSQPARRQAPAGQRWMVFTYPGTKIMVNGTANPDYLRTGLYVDFKAQYDGKALQDKVSELTVVSYSPDRPPGLYPGGAGIDSLLAPGAAPGPVRHLKKKDGHADAADAGMYEIIGRITSCKDNKLTVWAKRGEKALTVELSEFPKIAVALSDLSIARPGDRITATGKRPRLQTGGCLADEVTITLSEPLASPKKPALVAAAHAGK